MSGFFVKKNSIYVKQKSCNITNVFVTFDHFNVFFLNKKKKNLTELKLLKGSVSVNSLNCKAAL